MFYVFFSFFFSFFFFYLQYAAYLLATPPSPFLSCSFVNTTPSLPSSHLKTGALLCTGAPMALLALTEDVRGVWREQWCEPSCLAQHHRPHPPCACGRRS